MRAWRRSPFTTRYLLARCLTMLVPLLLGWAAAPAEARVVELVKARIDAELERALGQPVELGRVEIRARGIRVDDLRTVRARAANEVPAPAEVRAARAEIDVEWPALWREGRLWITRVRIDGLRARLGSDAIGGGTKSLPDLGDGVQVELRDASVERGTVGARGIDARLSLERGELRGDVSAAHVAVGALATSRARVTGALNAQVLRVDWLEVDVPGGKLTGRGTFDRGRSWLSARARLDVELGPKELGPNLAVRAGRGSVELDASGPIDRLQAQGGFRLSSLEVRSPELAAPVVFHSLQGAVRGSAASVELSDLTAVSVGDQVVVRGGATWTKNGLELEARAEIGRLARLRRLFPRLPLWQYVTLAPAATGQVLIRMKDGRSSGTFDLRELTLRAPETPLEPWPVARATGSFATSGRTVTLMDVQLYGRHGRARGSAELGGRRERVRLEAVGLPPELLGELLPGRFRRGSLEGEVVIAAERGRSPRVTGSAAIVDSTWLPPPEAAFRDTRLAVRRGEAAFDVQDDYFRVERLEVASDRLHLSGTVSGRPSRVRVQAELATRDAGKLLDAWPDLRGIARGGRGRATLDATWVGADVSGRVRGEVEGGMVLLPSAAGPEHSVHPLSRSRFDYRFAPAGRRLQQLALRGPELNLDVLATWNAAGRVTGEGRAWLTRAYAKELAGPWQLPLRVLGRFPLATTFTLRGDAEALRLNADIAHGVRWRLLRLGVPARLQAIARGETPVWRAETPAPR